MEKILDNSDLMMIDNMSNAVEMGQGRDMTSRLGDSINLLVPFTERQQEVENDQMDDNMAELRNHFAEASIEREELLE